MARTTTQGEHACALTTAPASLAKEGLMSLLCWLHRLSVPKSASPMTLSGPFPLHLTSTQRDTRAAHCAVCCPVFERISYVASTASTTGLHNRRSQRSSLFSVMGSHSSAVSCRSLFHRFLESLSSGDSARATQRCGKRNGRNSPCGTLEEYAPATLGSLCS
jgi:hypothetical protein